MSGLNKALASSRTASHKRGGASGPGNDNEIPSGPDRGHAPKFAEKANETMDPFEVRIRFTNHLQHLNASVTSSQKAAQYALKYRDMDEDLHSCILEQLERASSNAQEFKTSKLMILCDMASREGHKDYVRMMQRDILRIVDAVTPEDGSGAANVKVVRKVLQGLQTKKYLLGQTVTEIEECLKERDTSSEHLGLSSPLHPDDVEMGGTEGGAVQRSKQVPNGTLRQDKKQVEQRIEEDRERHKRLRENIWAVPSIPGNPNAEFDKLWEETSDLGEDDFILYAEEAAERRKMAEEWKLECIVKGVAE
ncbi:hypothetical protein BP5796_10080 [Coleophoma crateriformis]|uniref:CID domain-containing protein n=1 Tax=Coleophoma crateriformis TaxID=565419 RepID=A0A3D8QUM1_9HELO|nr:hypothetical protein BP5796_10080 [Coleophoma crateriformis]